MSHLAIASQKGGVGKTTVALNLAYAFAKRGYRTLLIDTDPQGAVGLSLARKNERFQGLKNYLAQEKPLEELVLHTRQNNLDLMLAGNVSVDEIDLFTNNLGEPDGLPRLCKGAKDQQYQLLIFDTPSGLGGISNRVLRMASHVVSPLQAEPLAFRSVKQLFEMLAFLRAEGSSIKLLGLLLTMLQNKDENSLKVAQEVWLNFPKEFVLHTTIPRDPNILSAGAAGVPVELLGKYPPPVVGIFDQLALELEPSLGLRTEIADDKPLDLLVS